MEKQDLQKLEFKYELFYLDYYCASFKSLLDAIERAKEIIKNNPENKGGFNIKLNNSIIAVY